MRLHALEIQAFGPFADTVTVDFDDLSGAGLFLLSGPTGAGKSSILDAVCFALYGDVPGDRSTAKRLRCDQAAPGLAPRVALEATLAGRRFWLVRSPAWERPKRRGVGTTPQQATVTISEQRDGTWEVLSSRLDETGHLVTELLGMNLPQFTQVALLPQGRFQTFLRAKSEERHRLLEKLFRTGRFGQVEQWLRDRRLALMRTSAEHHDRVSDLVSRISETAEDGVPPTWDLHDLAAEADEESIAEWAVELVERIRLASEEAAREAQAVAVEESGSRRSLEDLRRRAEWRDRLLAAAAERDRLEERAEAHDAELRRLRAGRRAAAVRPLADVLSTATTSRQAAEQRAATAVRTARDEAGDVAAEGVEGLAEQASRSAEISVRARAARPQAKRLAVIAASTEDLHGQRRSLARAASGLVSEKARLQAGLEDQQASVRLARIATAAETSQREGVTQAEEWCEAHLLAEDLTGELEAARPELSIARTLVLDLQESLMDLQQARIDGMAAELASALAVGADCPVCGSAEHPHKARAHPSAPDAESERTVRAELADAKVTELARDGLVRSLETRLAVAVDRAGTSTPAQARHVLAERRAELRATTETSAARVGLEARLEATEKRLETLVEDRAEVQRQDDALASRLTALADERSVILGELEALLDGAPDLDTLSETHQRLERVARAALDAEADAVRAREREAEASHQLDRAAHDAGFETAASAVSAALIDSDLAELETTIREHDRRLDAARSQLDEEGAREVLAAARPDIEALETDHGVLAERWRAAHAADSLLRGRTDRLAGLVSTLRAALADWAPVRADYELARTLSAFAEGKSADNRLQMRLSAYVLAYRLSQVVAAANLRLARMSDQRYSLEHTGHRGAGETRGGLSLLVRDDWSGETRDPATLSGGETFVVSLALALGLADVIADETGGADLETLFVDEGFGSLDSETLDDVMSTLDSLRDGGRVVGVVSHVAEMRDRIPTQLVVTKSRTGSATAVRH